LAKIFGCKFKRSRPEILFETMHLGRARNWNNPGLLRKQPRKGDLGRCRFLLLCKFAKQIDQRLIRFSILCCKSWNDVAEIGFVEFSAFADLAGEETFPKRTEWNKPDPEFLERRDHLRFWLSPPEGIFALKCRNRLHCVRATDSTNSCFRKSEVLHLTLLNQFLHRSCYLLDGDIWIDTVMIEEVDDIGLQSPE
jgi:hypothetical protein